MLVVDVGNTRVKWGLYDGNGWLLQGAAGHDELFRIAESVRPFQDIGPVIVSNVAGATLQTALHDLLSRLDLPVRWIQAGAEACGVRNGYARPAQLGSDRWAALIAAWHQHRTACVVASAGTALTVDALSSRGEFLGGMILPGLGLMKSALSAHTSGILQTEGEATDFPSSTGDAVHSGVLAAMAGAVERMCRSLAKNEGSQPRLLLSGGDAALLHEALSGHGAIMDNLVLEGLLLIARELDS